MLRTAALIACVAIASAIAWCASRAPEPQPASTPPTQFSAGRAFKDVEAIGSRAHPLGSAEHDRVRDYLIGRCRDLGLEVALIPGQAISRNTYPAAVFVEGGDVQDIACALPGRDRTLPAIALMAHYDTVPSSPGAADDSTGVAAGLEAVRAIKAQGTPLRDVMLLLSDGEEGDLLGARLFFGPGGMSRRVGAVLNMEARGGGGRAYMFETGARDQGLIEAFARAAASPTAASMSGFVYSLMPAGTDFTVAKTHGVTGLNYAFEGLPFDYHAASSTPAALDQGSLQHIGAQTLSIARDLAFARDLPKAGGDLVYADLLGGPVIFYPIWAGWGLLIAIAGLLLVTFRRAFRTESFGWLSALRGSGALIVATLAAGLVLMLVRQGTGAGLGLVEEKPLAARFGLYEGALAAGCLGAVWASFLAIGHGRGRFWSAFAGACAVALFLAAALQAAAPLTAYLVTWPLAVAALVAAGLAFRRDKALGAWPAVAFAAAVALLPLAQILYTAHPIALSIGGELPEAFAVFALTAALVLFPLLWPDGRDRFAWALAGLALLVAVVLTLVMRLIEPWSPRHPRPVEAVYVADLDHGRFLRASPLEDLDHWTLQVLTADGAPIRLQSLPPFARRAYVAPGWPVAVPRPDLLETWSRRAVTLKLTPGGTGRDLYLEFKPTTPISDVTVNGLEAASDVRAGQWTILEWHAPHAPLTIVFKAPRHLELDARYAEVIDGWPSDARPLPPLPADDMPWMDSGSTVLLGSTRYRW